MPSLPALGSDNPPSGWPWPKSSEPSWSRRRSPRACAASARALRRAQELRLRSGNLPLRRRPDRRPPMIPAELARDRKTSRGHGSRWLSSGCLSSRLGFGRPELHEFEHGAPLSTPTAVQALVERQCHVVGDVIRSHSRDRVARHAPPEYPVDIACSSLPRTGSATRSSKPSSARDARAAVEVASLAASSTPRRVRVLRIMFPLRRAACTSPAPPRLVLAG